MKTVHITDINTLKEQLSQLQIGDSVTLTKSSFDSKSINYHEFLFHNRASELGGDVLLDKDWEAYRMMLTFIKRIDTFFNYGRVINRETLPVGWNKSNEFHLVDNCERIENEIRDQQQYDDSFNETPEQIYQEMVEEAQRNDGKPVEIIVSKPQPLQIKKGDKVQTESGLIGIITKYPSNKSIEVCEQLADGTINNYCKKETVTKEQIIKKIN